MFKKNTTLKLFALFTGLTLNLFIAANAQNTPVDKNGQLHVCGTQLCNQYNNPIQLRGMSTHGLQWYGWGDCITEASLDALAYDWGADVLRISLYVQEGGYETDPAGFTAQVSRIIDEATERGMYALVDWHQLSPGDPNANLGNATTFFTAIANAHKNQNNIIYDICNEPNGVSWATIKTYADQIIPVIRAIDSDAVILIGTHGWASLGVSDGRTSQDIINNPVNFANIMYTFHFYANSHRNSYLNELNSASDVLPIFVTEFGTQQYTGDGPNDFSMSQQYIDLMRQKKISWTNWNYSDDSRSGAVWQSGTCSGGPWTVSNLKPAGQWVRERMLSPADDFPGGGGPGCQPVTASGDDGNVAANVLDDDLNTRWSASGDGQWIQFCLAETTAVNGVQIAFYKGDERQAIFDVQLSSDGVSWTTVLSGVHSSGSSLALETFGFSAQSAKYVRILGHGNTVNAWNSYTEVKMSTQGPATCTGPVTASGDDGNVAANVLDDNLNTRWSASGDGQWISFCLDDLQTVNAVQIAFYKGDERQAIFDIQLSPDGASWTTVSSGVYSSGSSLALETFGFSAQSAKYVRIMGHGNTVNAWNSYTEVKIGATATSPAGPETSSAGALKVVSYPNPGEDRVTVMYELKQAGRVTLSLYNSMDGASATLINEMQPAGAHQRTFDVKQLPKGIHFLRLTHNGQVTTHKLIK